MSLPRKGSRAITVDGVRYRWRIRRRPTSHQRRGQSPLLLAIAAEEGSGPAMVVRLHRAHPRNDVREVSFAVTPGQVAAFVQRGLEAGWRPLARGEQFNLNPRVDPVDYALEIDPLGHRPLGRGELVAIARARAETNLDVLHLDMTRSGERSTERPCLLSGLEINGRDLIEWVYDVERPLVDAERTTRDDATEDYAGQYLGLSESEYRLPSRALLGEVPSWGANFAFQTAPNDPRRRKTTLLDCTCGISECWFLLATIGSSGNSVGSRLALGTAYFGVLSL